MTEEISTRYRLADAVDIHSHPLPGIDDGATSLENSVMMACIAARFGTSRMVATPHRYFGGVENRPDRLRKLTTEVRAALAQTRFGSRFELLPGQEIPLRLETADELLEGRVLTLGDTGVYALVEPPFDRLRDWTAEALARIITAGFIPVLAHPERNAAVQRSPVLVEECVAAGALLQLTALSVTGENGDRARAAADWMLEEGLVAVVASDTHSPTWRPPGLRAAFRTLAARYGLETARRLCAETPRAIALGIRG